LCQDPVSMPLGSRFRPFPTWRRNAPSPNIIDSTSRYRALKFVY
jgi:hypothetical protein